MQRLLIIEDNQDFATSLVTGLGDQFLVDVCASVREAIKLLSSRPYDIILCDYILQGVSGLNVVSHVKTLVSAPKIVMMTAFAEKDMAIKALNTGVSHLLEKPFSVKKLRHVLGEQGAKTGHADSQAKFSPETSSVMWKGENIRLTPSEYMILSYLISQKNNWVSRDEFEKMLWDECPNISRNVLDTHIYNLRRKVPDLSERLLVVRGKGFSLKDLE